NGASARLTTVRMTRAGSRVLKSMEGLGWGLGTGGWGLKAGGQGVGAWSSRARVPGAGKPPDHCHSGHSEESALLARRDSPLRPEGQVTVVQGFPGRGAGAGKPREDTRRPPATDNPQPTGR